jgi:predicted dehydrogenase
LTTTKARIAILGLDHWYSALMFLPAFAREPRLEVAGIAHEDLGRARAVATANGVDRVVADAGELLADPTIDAVAIFTSTDRNPGLCIAAARAGKHILAIKPIARTLEEATAVVTAVRAAGVQFMPSEAIGPGGRRGPVQAVRDLVAGGRLGDVAFARCSISAGLPRSWPDDYAPGWFVDAAKGAGGGWVDHAIYEIDRLRWALGLEAETVTGVVANASHPELAVEDWGSALVRFHGGALAELRNDWFMPATSMYQGQWEVSGTRGVVRVDEVTGQVLFAGTPPDGSPMDHWEVLQVPANFDAATVAADVADVITGRIPSPATVDDAWRNLAVVVAFYEAARTGTTVRVQEGPNA